VVVAVVVLCLLSLFSLFSLSFKPLSFFCFVCDRIGLQLGEDSHYNKSSSTLCPASKSPRHQSWRRLFLSCQSQLPRRSTPCPREPKLHADTVPTLAYLHQRISCEPRSCCYCVREVRIAGHTAKGIGGWAALPLAGASAGAPPFFFHFVFSIDVSRF
jgi:hypothetical protein